MCLSSAVNIHLQVCQSITLNGILNVPHWTVKRVSIAALKLVIQQVNMWLGMMEERKPKEEMLVIQHA
jgi:hypothetical protein